ncbi:ATP-dependent DNA helicase DinG [Balneatrix alpica]|uniref:ATP-dependent DNA helicase DinG n=1 Tax=Balneatrix alpica TaxID=75684 RepID=UPI0027386C7A|nr:ATP-dependent DNA helicase DinG [Balneatrix alpica]
MLEQHQKDAIQQAYRTYLQAKQLKPRHGQRHMIAAIARMLGQIEQNDQQERLAGNHLCVVEAGTGTGKTVAYLLATLPLLREWKKTLVVSTATVALQEQIVFKDLPELRQHAGLDFRFALAKGRGRYLCPLKLERLQQGAGDPTLALFEQEQIQEDDAKQLWHQLGQAWQGQHWDGDRDAWPEVIADNRWSQLTTDHQQCLRSRCSFFNQCPFYKAREALEQADCVVANHDLVLADLSLGGGVILPEPGKTLYVFDEAHHLPDKALSHFTYSMPVRATDRWLKQLVKNTNAMAGQLRLTGDMSRAVEEIPSEVGALEKSLLYLGELLRPLWQNLERDTEVEIHRFSEGRVGVDLQDLHGQLSQGWERLAKLLDRLQRGLQQVVKGEVADIPVKDAEACLPMIGQFLGRVEEARALCRSYAEPDPEGSIPLARWLQRSQQGEWLDTEICSSPILAADKLRQALWNRCFAAVLCSATLTALNRFDRIMMRAGLPKDAIYEQVQSPFNHAEVASLHVPRLAADPSQAQAHTQAVTDWLRQHLNPEEGSLVLFSSRRQMEEVQQGLGDTWQELILAQGSRSKQEILNQHRQRLDEGQGSVLFGLASFAEGIDLPGNYLTHVIIAKIPFAVPDNPVDAGLAEWIEKRGGNPFMEISMPDASIRLVQAAGRLLRTEQDRGRITLLDSRVLTKRYGKLLLDALPPFRRHLD